ncbi:MAG TPA: hypothetical protein VJ718_03715, partial [Candidatus Binataceae bacterium]|nr:hypothetical protein [Candidatus Binataceae bacterium]
MRIERSPAAISERKAVEPRRENPLTPSFIAAIGILLAHFVLLVVAIPDYRVTIDSAYHVALGRAYGTHGLVTWDKINFGPRGRPNLQAPMLHLAIGALGRAIGGAGNSYIFGKAILAVLQWAAAMATAAWFAWRLGGATAMLFAATLLSGAAFAGGSFAAGIPSGWLFIETPWAIWFFLRRRTGASAAATSAAIYTHLGGYLTAPVGVFVAAAITRRWRALVIVGAITAILTAPYTIHVLRYLGWLSGVRSHSALLFDPMLDLLAIAGAVRILRHPRDNPFMTAWLLAPIAWVFQDPGRFFLQWPLGGSVAAALMLTDWINRIELPHRRALYSAAIAAIASLAPFGPPSLAAEIAWDAGMRWPRPVNWNRAHKLANEVKGAGLTGYLVADYNPALCPAIAVYAPISCEKG